MDGGKNRGGGGEHGGKEEGRGRRYQGNTEREREAALKEADVIAVKQPIREQQGGTEGGEEWRQSSEGCVLCTTAA